MRGSDPTFLAHLARIGARSQTGVVKSAWTAIAAAAHAPRAVTARGPISLRPAVRCATNEDCLSPQRGIAQSRFTRLCDNLAAMTNIPRTLFFALATCFAVGCAAQPAAPDDVQTSSSEAATTVTCTPGQETCDIGCYYNGGPSTDDCIIKCNAYGTGWNTITSCGYAQNWPTSASCLNSQPHPVCENN